MAMKSVVIISILLLLGWVQCDGQQLLTDKQLEDISNVEKQVTIKIKPDEKSVESDADNHPSQESSSNEDVMLKFAHFQEAPKEEAKITPVTFKDSNEEQQDSISADEGNVEELNTEETLQFLSQFVDHEYGGRWSLDTAEDVYNINPNFIEKEGKARLRMQLSTAPSAPGQVYFEFLIRLYEGSYLNQNSELSTSFKVKNGTKDGIIQNEQPVRIESGHLFSKPTQHVVLSNVKLKFQKDLKTGVRTAFFSMQSIKGSNFKLEIDFSYPYDDMISGWSVLRYAFLLFFMCASFCSELIKQTKRADESPLVAQRLSLFTLSWNTMWNMWLFNIHSTYALYDSHYYLLSLPSIMYFIICIIFEITLLHICWKARNNNLVLENQEEVRRQIIIFYLKFYITYIVAVSLSDMIFSNCLLLIIINGLIWVPQICENVQNRARNVPSPRFAITLSVSQGFMPIYFLFTENNIFEIKNSPMWGLILLFLHVGSIAILFGQKKLGSRFFIPKSMRGKSSYQYQQLADDLEEDADKDCAICLNHLSEPQGANNQHREDAVGYMKTPCGHKFHPYCLKTWMRQKLECPSCRTEIPAFDSDEEEEMD